MVGVLVPVLSAPRRVRAFSSAAAFETWLAANHRTKTELYLRIFKKDSGKRTVTYAEAVDVALCWGWIDGIRLAFDAQSFLQRLTPRRPKSVWSQINRGHVARLIAAGRMTPPGLAAVAAAKADGRWESAYAPSTTMTVPDDLIAAVKREPRAWTTFQSLNRQNRYALAYRLGAMKTAAGRAQRLQAFVDMLKKGQTIYPQPAQARLPKRKPDITKRKRV